MTVPTSTQLVSQHNFWSSYSGNVLSIHHRAHTMCPSIIRPLMKHFKRHDEVKTEEHLCRQTLIPHSFPVGIKQVAHNWDKCLRHPGNYVDIYAEATDTNVTYNLWIYLLDTTLILILTRGSILYCSNFVHSYSLYTS